jgi:hypothetical protein
MENNVNKENSVNNVNIEIKIDDEIAEGNFSNFTNISHSPEEFTLDFVYINPTPSPGFGKLKSRIILTPGHVKRLITALQENLDKYEERFGDINAHNNGTEKSLN